MAIERIDYHGIEMLGSARHAKLSPEGERLDHASAAARRREAFVLMSRAARAFDDDPRRAASLIEQAEQNLVGLWFARHGHKGRPISADDALEQIARQDRDVALQIRLARSANDDRARLRHCRALLILIERAAVGLESLDAGCAAALAADHWPQPLAGQSAVDASGARGV